MDFYGTLGPSSCTYSVLAQMYDCGMTGVRLNLSHGTLRDHADWLKTASLAAKSVGKQTKILIDLQGPELRVGTFSKECILDMDSLVILGHDGIPVPDVLLEQCREGMHLLLDDGKIKVEIIKCNGSQIEVKVLRGGILKSRKSITVCDVQIDTPTLTEQDLLNLRMAKDYGVTGVMLPFVRGADDLINLKRVLEFNDAKDIQIFAKIENMQGVSSLESFLPLSDEIVIARGDLGNSMPLWELPRIQKRIANQCKKANKPFMVVTQMLDSMEHRQVPTRAEVSDIYNAVLDGAASVMLTGETAVGEYPIDAMNYLVRTASVAMEDRINEY